MSHCLLAEMDPLICHLGDAQIEGKVRQIRESAHSSTPGEALGIVPFIDLTSLTVFDDAPKISDLCSRSLRPLGSRNVAAVCCFSRFAKDVVDALGHRDSPGVVRTAVVCGGFPHSQVTLQAKEAEIREAVASGVAEVDLVVPRDLMRRRLWDELHSQIGSLRQCCGPATLKVIISTGDVQDWDLIQRSAAVSVLAGCDFVKLCTGVGQDVASLEAGICVSSVLWRHFERTGRRVGLKTSGGIRTVQQALQWVQLVKQELGSPWFVPSLFRIGASSLLDDIVSAVGASLY